MKVLLYTDYAGYLTGALIGLGIILLVAAFFYFYGRMNRNKTSDRDKFSR